VNGNCARARAFSLSLSFRTNVQTDRRMMTMKNRRGRENGGKKVDCVLVCVLVFVVPVDCGLWCTYGVSWRVKKQHVEGAKKKKLPPPNLNNVKFWAGYLVTGKKFEQGVQ